MVNFAVPPDHRVKLKESEKRDKCQDRARERKNGNKGNGDINCNRYS